MSDEPTSTPHNDCENCPACVRQKRKADIIVARFTDVDRRADKLYDAYRANLNHINIQKEKIRVAERVMMKFELSLKANIEDMIALSACAKRIYDDMDADGNLHYEPEKKAQAIARLTLPPPPGT